MPVRINSLAKASHDVMVVRLQLPASDVFKYHAGQYVEFLLRDGDRRAYSMGNAPHTQADNPGVELHIRHMPGGKFTEHVFGPMKEKEILRIEGPFGSFYLREDSDKPMVLLASGTGFAPIKALIEHLQFKGITRPAVLYWGGRRPGRPVHGRVGEGQARPKCRTCATCRWCPTPCPRTTGPAAPALSTRPCWKISPTCRATRCMLAARPSWWIRPRPPTPPPACRKTSFTPTPL